MHQKKSTDTSNISILESIFNLQNDIEKMFTFNLSLKESGKSFWFTLARVSRILDASSNLPLAKSHLGDSGRNLA